MSECSHLCVYECVRDGDRRPLQGASICDRVIAIDCKSIHANGESLPGFVTSRRRYADHVLWSTCLCVQGMGLMCVLRVSTDAELACRFGL